MPGRTKEKNIAVTQLMDEYRDSYGRVTLHPAKNSDPENGKYDSENQNLWTGEASILIRLAGYSGKRHNYFSHHGFISTTVEPGLISRHPHPFWEDPNHHKVSWDEFNGLMYHSITLDDERTPQEVLDYGRKHFWIYLDGEFGMKNRTFKERMKLYLGGLRQPRDVFFYKIAAGIKPNLFETLWAATSHILTSRKPAGVTSGKIMAWLKNKALEIKGYKGIIWKWANKRFDKNMKKCYNSDTYMEEVAKIYFPKEHPFHVLFKGLK